MATAALSVCLGENMAVDDDGRLKMAPWSVPRNLVDEIIRSGADTAAMPETITLPGRLLMDKQVMWFNDTPVDHTIRVEVTRRWKRWVVSNPNSIEFRDRWTNAISPTGTAVADIVTPEIPVVTGILNSQCGSGEDTGTNTVAEPNPGVFYHWSGTNVSEEWLGPIKPGETLSMWYRMYVWTPPPFSNNANKNSPVHQVEAGWTRFALMGFPDQGELVTG